MGKKLTVRDRVLAYMDKHDLTQAELAPLVGMSEARLSKVLSGKAMPTGLQLIKFDQLLNIPARDFAGTAA